MEKVDVPVVLELSTIDDAPTYAEHICCGFRLRDFGVQEISDLRRRIEDLGGHTR